MFHDFYDDIINFEFCGLTKKRKNLNILRATHTKKINSLDIYTFVPIYEISLRCVVRPYYEIVRSVKICPILLGKQYASKYSLIF